MAACACTAGAMPVASTLAMPACLIRERRSMECSCFEKGWCGCNTKVCLAILVTGAPDPAGVFPSEKSRRPGRGAARGATVSADDLEGRRASDQRRETLAHGVLDAGRVEALHRQQLGRI